MVEQLEWAFNLSQMHQLRQCRNTVWKECLELSDTYIIIYIYIHMSMDFWWSKEVTHQTVSNLRKTRVFTHTHKIEKNNYRSQAVLNGLQWGTFFKKCHQKWVAVIPSACWMPSNILKKMCLLQRTPRFFTPHKLGEPCIYIVKLGGLHFHRLDKLDEILFDASEIPWPQPTHRKWMDGNETL